METHLSLRNAHDDEQKTVRDLTLVAYEQYRTLMPPNFWIHYQHNLVATLDETGGFEHIVAEQHGTIVGSILFYPPGADAYASAAVSVSYPEFRLLAVLPQVRGQGVGTALVQECERRAREAGAQAIGLHTATIMRDAVRMYERLGYVRTPETDFHIGEDVIVLGYRRNL